ncbi:MAG TPA: ADOP family duplicated permease [Thermoanaerobaculia bacterium]|nr:ADOP family duplicated permease [Thermoanaerobaculia bacterium]
MWHELRYSLRRLGRNPLVSSTVILTLAVGVGAVTTAFTVVHGTLSPLEFPQAERLVRIYQTLSRLKTSPNARLAAIWNQIPVSYLNAADFRHRSRTLRGIGLYESYTAVLEPGGEPLEVAASRIDSELLGVLGAAPLLGRPFTAAEVARRDHLALLSHGLWTHVFGADKGILGRAIRLEGQQYTVIGIMAPGFEIPGQKDSLWTPAGLTDDDLAVRDENSYSAIGRLAPRATLEASRTEMDRLAAGLAKAHPETNADTGVRIVPLLETVIGDSRRVLTLLSAAAVAVLLIACVNLSNILLAQGMERRGEMALRLTLGARRAHLVRQSAVETLILAVAGSAVGLVLAVLARRVLPLVLAAELPRLEKITLDGAVVLFALGASLVATLFSGLLPAILAAGAAARQAMSERSLVHIAQDALVIVEVALTLTLTVGALALVASWRRLATIDPGFDAPGVLVQEIRLPAWQYPDDVRRGSFATRLLATLETIPGIGETALASRLPVSGKAEIWGFHVAGQEPPSRDWTQGLSATMQFVTPEYFRLLRIPVLAGESFDDRSGSATAPVLMLNRTLADRLWPGRSPVSELVAMHDQQYRVLGVFRDFKQRGLADPAGELMIQPWAQRPAATFSALFRVRGRPMDYAPVIRRRLRELDPALPLSPAALLEDLVAGSAAGPRSRALLVGLLAGVAMLLALIGTYGVLAYGVGRRRREIAIRLTIGADRRWVQLWVLRRALALALAGVLLGGLGALAAGRLLAGLLYGVTATDPQVLAGAAFLLIAACLAAGYFPARRASRIDPAMTLREE